MVIGGGPELSLDIADAEDEEDGGLLSFSSPETSASPFTFRFSAVFSKEERRSY